MKKEIKICGMHRSHCVRVIEEALEEIRAKQISVCLDTETAIANVDDTIGDREIISALENLGYEVVSITEVEENL